jgi:hypothetical protein
MSSGIKQSYGILTAAETIAAAYDRYRHATDLLWMCRLGRVSTDLSRPKQMNIFRPRKRTDQRYRTR